MGIEWSLPKEIENNVIKPLDSIITKNPNIKEKIEGGKRKKKSLKQNRNKKKREKSRK